MDVEGVAWSERAVDVPRVEEVEGSANSGAEHGADVTGVASIRRLLGLDYRHHSTPCLVPGAGDDTGNRTSSKDLAGALAIHSADFRSGSNQEEEEEHCTDACSGFAVVVASAWYRETASVALAGAQLQSISVIQESKNLLASVPQTASSELQSKTLTSRPCCANFR